MMDINVGLIHFFCKFFNKTALGGPVTRADNSVIKSEFITNQTPSDQARIAKVSDHTQQLAEKLHKPVTRNFEKRKICSSFKDNIWDAGQADMQLISKYNIEFRLLLCVI